MGLNALGQFYQQRLRPVFEFCKILAGWHNTFIGCETCKFCLCYCIGISHADEIFTTYHSRD